MMRRVSSRPRLVSDADKAFVNATVELSDGALDGSGYADYSSFDDDGLYLDDDSHYQAVHNSSHVSPLMAAAPKTSPLSSNDCEGNSGNPDKEVVVTSQSYASSGDLSGYLTCLEDNTGPTGLLMPRPPSLLDLPDSFQKKASFVIPADYDDDVDAGEDKKPPAAGFAAAMATSTKRKRLSQSYLTPRSSYTSFTNGQWLYHPLSISQSKSQEPVSSLQTLPQESLICIATYLTINDVRVLATSCHSVRGVLMTSQGATTDIWIKQMKEAFPYVFSRIDHGSVEKIPDENDKATSTVASRLDEALARLRNNHNWLDPETLEVKQVTRADISSHEVTFVDDYRLPIPGLLEDETYAMNNDGTYSDKVNLPLLTGLIPQRYPQAIDSRTLVDRLRFGQQRSGQIFRSYTIKLDTATGAIAESSGEIVPVVQFAGTVGHGDRCIRSDMPFPPNCTKVQCSCGASCRSRSESCSSSTGSFSGLTDWMRSRSLGKRKSRRHRANSSGRPRHMPSFRSNSTLSSTTSTGPFQPTTPVGAGQVPPSTPEASPQSPLYRFLSSLSHHCTSPESSVHGSRSSSYLDESVRSGSGNESSGSEDEHGLNNYGMMVKHSLVSKCKQCMGKLRNYGGNFSNSDNLRPFVIPTVVEDNSKGLVVDVTPRLVAYFEITIVKQCRDAGPQDQNSGGLRRRPIHNNTGANEGALNHAPRVNMDHRNNNLQRPPRHNNLWRMPHRAMFPPMNLPLPLEAAMVGAHFNADQAVHHHQHQPVHHEPQNLPMNEHGQQRHECVAIGLSTQYFSPSNKMPGWDMDSYGYHGDDGGIFHGQGDMLRQYGPSFGPGDTVGCGLEYSSRRIFFVKNGVFLGYAFGGSGSTGNSRLSKEAIEDGLYPTVGVDTTCPIFVNFGDSPFKFDLNRFASAAGSASDQ